MMETQQNLHKAVCEYLDETAYDWQELQAREKTGLGLSPREKSRMKYRGQLVAAFKAADEELNYKLI